MAHSPLFPAFYFGSVEHFALIAQCDRLVIDLGEHYERQSYRTRTTIMGANGPQHLQVHIARRSREKMPMGSVGLSYAEPWPSQHVQALRSAYGQTPWFIHYIGDLEEVLLRTYERLADLDLGTMRLALGWLGLRPAITVANAYVEAGTSAAEGLLDLRTALHPKRALPAGMPVVPPYTQVFADRHGFHPRLSIIDLVMNLGPEARTALQRAV